MTKQFFLPNPLGSVALHDHGGAAYDALAYGLVNDGQVVADGSMTSGSAVLTSVSSLFAASDVGKNISVTGVGAAGVPITTTIASYQAANQVTLSITASTTLGTAKVLWGTDNTAALRTLITTVQTANGGKIYLPNGIYACFGAQVAHANGSLNGLINIPYVSIAGTLTNINIAFEGETPPGQVVPLSTGYPSASGATFACFTAETVAGGASNNGRFFYAGSGAFSGVEVSFKNLTILLPNQTTWNGLDLLRSAAAVVENVNVAAYIPYASVLQPPALNAGIVMPTNNNNAQSIGRNNRVFGFSRGHVVGEHFHGDDVGTYRCVCGVSLMGSGHPINFNRINVEQCINVIESGRNWPDNGGGNNNNAIVSVAQLDIEDAATGQWYSPGSHISDASFNLYGTINYVRTSPTAAMFAPITVSGAAGLALNPVGLSRLMFPLHSPLPVTMGVAAGTTPPAATNSLTADSGGTITFGSGTSPTTGIVLTTTFLYLFGKTPIGIILFPNNEATRLLGLSASITTTGFTVSVGVAPAASQANTTYSFSFLVMGYQ